MQMRAARRRRRHSGRLARDNASFMPWGAGLQLGIVEIDRQHQWLVERINRLHGEVVRRRPRARLVGQVLEDLIAYTHNHFIVEELLFQQHGYPESEAHKTEHDRFTRRAQEWLTRFEAGEAIVTLDAMDFLKDWLVHHICVVDRAYAPFMREHGVR